MGQAVWHFLFFFRVVIIFLKSFLFQLNKLKRMNFRSFLSTTTTRVVKRLHGTGEVAQNDRSGRRIGGRIITAPLSLQPVPPLTASHPLLAPTPSAFLPPPTVPGNLRSHSQNKIVRTYKGDFFGNERWAISIEIRIIIREETN